MLIDELTIRITAGHGGAGKYAPIKSFKSIFVGGDGGKGGNVYVSATTDLSALNKYSGIRELKADDGQRGGKNDSTGRSGKDLEIKFPLGTSVVDLNTKEVVAELDTLNKKILLCKGGLGGRGGNYRAQAGLPGQSIEARLILKLIAKYGLIGLPNAGKSSLLNTITNANAEVGAYPFTTLEPNLGVCNNQVIADIPGLIEGASSGKGLGIKFLKHIEKVSLLFHCIACDSKDVLTDYQVITSELRKFGAGLIDKPRVIVLTKTDLVSLKDIVKQTKILKKFKHDIIALSIYDVASLEAFKAKFFLNFSVRNKL